MRIVFITIDGNHAAALHAAAERLRVEHGVTLIPACYDAASLREESGWRRLERDLNDASFVFGARLFGEEYVRPLERLLTAAKCPVLIITVMSPTSPLFQPTVGSSLMTSVRWFAFRTSSGCR